MCVSLSSSTTSRLTDVTLRYNRIHDCGDGWLKNCAVDGIRVHHNLFNGAVSAIYNEGVETHIDCPAGAVDGVYANNTIIVSDGDWGTCFYNDDASFSSFVNNICVHDVADYALSSVSINEPQVDYNVFYSTISSPRSFHWNGVDYSSFEEYQDARGGGNVHSIFDDPDFEDGSYTLLSSSPAVDNGLNLGFTRDIDGTPVPSGEAPDIGAFERP